MRAWKAVVVLAGIGVAVWYLPEFVGRSRGIQVEDTDPRIESSESAGLFVGVRKFDHLVDVPYAADDAVDLAYFFTLDPRGRVLPPSRVVLALSGTPQKPESIKRRDELRDAGAKIEKAEAANILELLDRQANLVGTKGALFVSIASHGYVIEGKPQILGVSSRVEYPESTVSLDRLLDIASKLERSIFFIDACRERIATGTRSAAAQPNTAAPLLKKMENYTGQVVFYAARAGGYAYDDHVRKNGVFTGAVLDGLSCQASSRQDTVRVETLRTYVERQVLEWIRIHRDSSIESATQISFDGNSGRMPLAQCPAPAMLMQASVDGSQVTAIDERGKKLWLQSLGELVGRTAVEDLDSDGHVEMVVATPKTLSVLNHIGKLLWRKSDPMRLIGFDIDVRSRGVAQKQVVALWSDGRMSRLISYGAKGEQLESFDVASGLQNVMLYRPTKLYNPKIIVTGSSDVQLVGKKDESWRRALPSSAIKLESADCDGDKRKDIAVTTRAGVACYSIKGELLTR